MPKNAAKSKQQSNFSHVLRRLYKSNWLFPVILIFILLVLTSLKISGTSVGIYSERFYGKNTANPSLVSGEPRAIRSDEYLFNTQLTISQSRAGFPLVNSNFNTGRDVSVSGDVAYKDWSVIFKPQNLIFFILPLEYAFAFKWWLILLLVIVSCYFFILHFLPRRRLLAAVIAVGFGFSPFLFWWYQAITLAPIIYGFLILLLGMKILDNEKLSFMQKRPAWQSAALSTLALTYLLACFALVLYPPFQIAVGLIVGFYLVGYALSKYSLKGLFSKSFVAPAATFAVSILLSVSIVGAFLYTRIDAVHAINNTVYPGKRHVVAGQDVPSHLLASYLQPQLQSEKHGESYYTNQSNASNFLLFLPFLLLPGFIIIYLEYKRRKKIAWPLLMVQLATILVLCSMFLGGPQIIYDLFLLDKMPASRLRLGLGFAGLIQLVLIIKYMGDIKLTRKYLAILISYLAICGWILVKAGISEKHHFPLYINNKFSILFWAASFVFIIFCILIKRPLVGAFVFLVFSILSSVHIQPLYKGLAPLYPMKLSTAIQEQSKPGSRWAVIDDISFENIPSMSNRVSIGGTQPYPDINFWRKLEGSKNDRIYNRYAHVLFTTESESNKKIRLVYPDSFEVKFECGNFEKENIDYALSTHPLNSTCLTELRRVEYPKLTFYLYRVF